MSSIEANSELDKIIAGGKSTPQIAMVVFAKEEDTPEEGKDPKACLFCGMHSRFTRYVNGQTVYVCDEHYHTTNIGKTAQKLREMELQNA